MKLKQIIKIIFFTLFLNSIFFAASANPNIYTNIKIPDEIKFKLDNSNYNKYLKRGMRAYVDGEIDGSKNIEKKYKKWAEAKIVLEYGPISERESGIRRFRRTLRSGIAQVSGTRFQK